MLWWLRIFQAKYGIQYEHGFASGWSPPSFVAAISTEGAGDKPNIDELKQFSAGTDRA